MSLDFFDIPILVALGVFILVVAQAVSVAISDWAGIAGARLSPELTDLADEKRRALSSIKIADLDYEAGRIDEKDYLRLKERASLQVIELTKRLDKKRESLRFTAQVDQALKESEPRHRPAVPERADGDILVDPGWLQGGPEQPKEQKTFAHKAQCPSCGDPVLEGDQFCSGCGAVTSTVCPECGGVCREGAKFCKDCGAPTGDPSSPSEVES